MLQCWWVNGSNLSPMAISLLSADVLGHDASSGEWREGVPRVGQVGPCIRVYGTLYMEVLGQYKESPASIMEPGIQLILVLRHFGKRGYFMEKY